MTLTARRPPRLLSLLLALVAISACQREQAVPVEELFTTRTLALSYLQRGQLAEAEVQFKKLIELAPDDPLGYANLGLTHLQQGRYEDAERQLQQARKLDPANPDVQLMIAKLYALTRRADEAREILEALIRQDPRNARALYALAELDANGSDAATIGRHQDRLQRALAIEPANLAVRLALIDVLVRRGLADSAVRQLEEVRRLPPAPPAEARAALDSTIQLLRAERMPEARAFFDRLQHTLQLTSPYQASLAEVKWIEAPLPGTPLLTFVPTSLISQRGLGQQAPADSVRFADATESSGLLDVLPAPTTAPSPATRIAAAAGDIDGDGTDDLFVSSITSTQPSPRPHLFRVRGGFAQEVTGPANVALPAGVTFATFADYDNDGWLDLFAIGAGSQPRMHVFRNRGNATFEETSARVGIGDQAGSVAGALRARFADLDHDGDLDVVLLGDVARTVYRNNLDGTFTDATASFGLAGLRGSTDAVFGDVDGDGRIDVMAAKATGGIAVFRNGGASRFSDVTAASGLTAAAATGAAIALGDYDNDGHLDLFLASPGSEFTFWRNRGDGTFARDGRTTGAASASNGVTARAALFADYDNDGRLDLVVTGAPQDPSARGMLLLRNVGAGRFENRTALLPASISAAEGIESVDIDDDGDLDFLVATTAGVVRLVRNDGGNANLAVRVQLKGLGTGSGKNNVFGVGARLELRAGQIYQTRVATSRVTHFGLGPHLKADVLRVEWPNGMPQTIYFPGTDQDVVELEALKGSCAFAYTWDGTRFRFVTDVMWRSALGMPLGLMGGASAFAPAGASQEYIRIPGDALKPRNGRYVMQITEELWETAYADEIKLIAVDHPDSVDVFVDERFVPPGPVSMRLFHAVQKRPPLSAVDERGNDVLPALRHHDDVYVSNLTPLQYQGVTEPHEIVLNLGPEAGGPETRLFLRGWIYPTDASINVALSQQSKISVSAPTLEVRDAAGNWKIVEHLGFPSGKDKTIVIDLAGRFPTTDHHVRIRTSMQIYWDQAFSATTATNAQAKVATLSPVKADLHARGFSRMYRKGGRYGPFWFDYDSVAKDSPWRPITGSFTRFGDVLPLLERGDDMYVIMAPGDETTLEFDASSAASIPPGWKRDFLLYSDGWIKDSDLNTAHGTTVGPLPYHKIKSYPYAKGDRYPTDSAHQSYLRQYNTRVVTGRTR